MLAYRVIARLDIKGENVIKGVQFEGLRVMGNAPELAKRYANDGADELLYMDAVASLYGRNQLENFIEETSRNIFIPVTVGGGIRSVGDLHSVLAAGADKVAINSAAVLRRDLIAEISDRAGRQCLVVAIEAKRINGGWEAYTDCGRIPSGKDAIRWAREAEELGAGEILIISIDRDGTRKGPDMDLLKAIEVDVPVIYSGGIRLQDVREVAEHSDGMAIGASLHYGDCTIQQVKDALRPYKDVR